ncbi:MAG: zinc-ribbon and FHA domain-containing protein [Actinobacteria bacterium]|nr:zinc-ribbon and FHA domain-containing protein [Actinomycetota bacterium]MBK5227305.1 zinc-ribbon and FHA domain-containing protein [Actinomycetota bacterium]
MYCTNCGHRNPKGANFCSSCGAALTGEGTDTTITFAPAELEADLEEEIHISPEELEGGRGVLVVKRGPNAGSKFFLDSETTEIGRNPDSDIFLDDITVSRRHAEITRKEGEGFKLNDVGSLNGTYVNKERVEEAELRSGDEIQVGKFKLIFLTGS